MVDPIGIDAFGPRDSFIIEAGIVICYLLDADWP